MRIQGFKQGFKLGDEKKHEVWQHVRPPQPPTSIPERFLNPCLSHKLVLLLTSKVIVTAEVAI